MVVNSTKDLDFAGILKPEFPHKVITILIINYILV